MPKDFEVDACGFGGMIFEMVLRDRPGQLPEHWASIIEKARPLVHQLLALNEEMKPSGYKLTGYVKDGKPVLTKHERIEAAQQKLWKIKAGKCKKGDFVWLVSDYDFEMHIGDNPPVEIVVKTGNTITADHPYDRHAYIKIDKNDDVLKAPADFDEKEAIYCSDEYWIEQADALGI